MPLHAVVLAGARDVLCELRGNRRFAYLPSFVTSAPAEHPLVHDIKRLRDVVRAARLGAGPFPPDALSQALDPFFRIITSRDTSGNITGVALGALDRVATSMLTLPPRTLAQYAPVLSAIVSSVASCRFDASDPAKDEVVLARITRVIARIVACPASAVLLSDAAILLGFEACLDIAAGRRRTSELLKRTADAALVDIATVLASAIPTAGETRSETYPDSPAPEESVAAMDDLLSFESSRVSCPSSVAIDRYLLGGGFGSPFDIQAHAQHGPASVECLAAILELTCKMSDPAHPCSASARMVGPQVLSAVLSGGGESLRTHSQLRRLLVRECSRAVLRAVGSFSEPPAFISASFSVAAQLGHALGSDGTAFMTALLQKVFPYYISGLEGVLPRLAPMVELEAVLPGSSASRAVAGGTTSSGAGLSGATDGTSSDGEGGDGDGASSGTEIDPVVREVGLEALCSFVSTPGMLASMYQVTDCNLACGDVTTTLLLSLGGATNSRLFRRRGKRLRASSGGSLSSSNVVADGDSDDEDSSERNGGAAGSSERARHARAAAIICAECLMTVVDTISERMRQRGANGVNGMSGTDGDSGEAESRVAELRARRVKKRQLQVTAESFNDPSFSAGSATKLLKLLSKHGQVNDTSVATSVDEDRVAEVTSLVRFLRETPGLNKSKIGTVLGEPDKLSQAVLNAYTNTFDFEERPFTECLRIFLESFRLPGESQKIDRIVESFADRFHGQNKPDPNALLSSTVVPDEDQYAPGEEMTGPTQSTGSGGGDINADDGAGIPEGQSSSSLDQRRSSRGVFANSEAVYTLSFAVVMLNTDQHNPSIRKKMTADDFVRNTRGINDKKDLPRWFLMEIFESIAAVEIRMSDEAGMRALTDLHWDEQLREMVGRRMTIPDASVVSDFDEDVFKVCWACCISAASVVFNEASDAGSVQKALEGLLAVARCGAAFRRNEPTDAVVSVLSQATAVREGPLYGAAVRFGTDIKAQMASVALSGVSRQCGDWMRANGWMALVAYVLRLHALGLLPAAMEEALGGYGNDLTGVDGSALPPSDLTPSWWPSQMRRAAKIRADSDNSTAKSSPVKKQVKSNGFFALLAATIGADAGSDDEYDSEEDEVYHDITPSYLKLRSAEDAEAEDLARKCVSACRIDDVLINEAKVLRSEALSCLANSLAKAASDVLDGDAADLYSGPVPVANGTDDSSGFGNGSGANRADSGDMPSDVAGGGGGGRAGVGATGHGGTGPDGADKAYANPPRDSSIISGTARLIRSSGSSVENEVDLDGFGLSTTWTGAIRERDERKARATVVAFCIDTLCELTLQNRDRLHIPWPALHSILLRVIDRNTRSFPLLERAVVALLRVASRLLHREEIHSDVLRGLNLIVNLPAKTAAELSIPLSAGVYNVVKTYGPHVSSVSGWHALLSIIENCARFPPLPRDTSFQSLSFLLTDDPSFEAVSGETFAPLLDAVLAYTACPSMEVSMCALDLLYSLAQRIPKLTEQSRDGDFEAVSEEINLESPAADRAWGEYWGPLLRGFGTASRDPRGKVRNTALSVLENVIAIGGPAGHLTAEQWHIALSSSLLPLMNDLFTSHGLLKVTLEAERAAQKRLVEERNAAAAEAAPRGRAFRTSVITPEHDAQLMKTVLAACDRTRLRAVMLMSKTFLQHHACMAEGLPSSVFTEIWLGVLGSFKNALQGGRRDRGVPKAPTVDAIREHVPESIKNILLVLCANGLLDKESNGDRWQETFRVLDKCLPDLELESFVIRATNPPSPVPSSQTKEVVDEASEEAVTSAEEAAIGAESATADVADTSEEHSEDLRDKGLPSEETAKEDVASQVLLTELPVEDACNSEEMPRDGMPPAATPAISSVE